MLGVGDILIMSKSTKSTLAKAAGTVACLTVVNKTLGFFREASLAAVFGATSATDAYLVAQTIPNLLFATISYALTTTFIPVYSHVREERGSGAAFGFACNVLGAVLVLGLAFVVIGEVLADFLVGLVAPGFEGTVAALTAYLCRIIFPMMIFQLLSGVMTGILQAHGEFAVSTAAGLVQNVTIIASILVFGPHYGIASVAVGALVGAGLATVVKITVLPRTGFRLTGAFSPRDPGIRRMAVLMLPAIVGAGAGQLNTLADRILASGLPEGRVSALNYANKLMQLAPGIFGTSILTVTYPTLARMTAQEKWESFSSGLVDALSLVYFFLAPIAVGVVVLREPLIRIVYQRGVFDTAATEQTARALLFLGLGIGIFTMRDLVSRAFFTMQDTTTPALVGFMTVGINVVLNLLLVGPLEQGGLALATTVASLVGLVTSLLVLNRRSPAPLPLRRLASSVVRTGFAALVMGFVVWAVQGYISTLYVHGTAMELVFLILVVGIGAGVYSGLAWFLRVPCLKMVVEAALQMSRRMRFVSRGSP